MSLKSVSLNRNGHFPELFAFVSPAKDAILVSWVLDWEMNKKNSVTRSGFPSETFWHVPWIGVSLRNWDFQFFFPGFSLVFRTFSMEFPAGCPWPGQGRPATLRGGGFQADAGSQAVWSPGDPLGFWGKFPPKRRHFLENWRPDPTDPISGLPWFDWKSSWKGTDRKTECDVQSLCVQGVQYHLLNPVMPIVGWIGHEGKSILPVKPFSKGRTSTVESYRYFGTQRCVTLWEPWEQSPGWFSAPRSIERTRTTTQKEIERPIAQCETPVVDVVGMLSLSISPLLLVILLIYVDTFPRYS